MANRMKLGEVDELLRRYRSERRVLNFQMNKLRLSIKELRKLYSSLERDETVKQKREGVVKRGPGRPRKNAAPQGKEVAQKRKRKGRPGRPKRKPGEGPALNAWDTAVINAISSKDQLMPKSKIMDHVTTWARKNEPGMKPAEVEMFVTRALQKLSSGDGRRLGTHHSGLRRGNHYGLLKWFFKSSGKLRASALNKLDLSEELEK
jgi:hypothetical protein